MVAPRRPSDQHAAEDDSALDELEAEELDLEDPEWVDPEEELADSPLPVLHPRCLEETARFFSEEGPLKQAEAHGGRPYEPRPQQAAMANAIAAAFERGANLCIEAPTGVGKSFAYLVPAIHMALSTKHPVLITTETLNLQEQLVYKDLPLLTKLLGVDLKFVLAKGRGNYLCKRRLALARGGHREEFLPAPGLVPDVERLADWADKTEDGTRYGIESVQSVPDVWPPCLDVSLKRIDQIFDVRGEPP